MKIESAKAEVIQHLSQNIFVATTKNILKSELIEFTKKLLSILSFLAREKNAIPPSESHTPVS